MTQLVSTVNKNKSAFILGAGILMLVLIGILTS